RAMIWMGSEVPRDQAAAYLKHVSSDDSVAGLPSDPWTWSVPLFKNSTVPRMTSTLPQRLQMMQAAVHPKVAFYADDDGHPFDVRLLTEIKPQFVAETSLEAQPVSHLMGASGLDGVAQVSVDRFKQFSDELTRSYQVVRVFGAPA